ncbi:MAG: glucoamylase family protein [Pseudomonadota bacterium]
MVVRGTGGGFGDRRGPAGPLNRGRPPRGLDDDALLDAVARAALAYFTDFAHPVSGMARERSAGAFGYDLGETVTTGGTGFGLMALVSGAERGWIGRAAAEAQVARIAGFLARAERHRGVFPHFMHGTTGATIAFSPGDDGGDIVETAFLAMGLIAARGAFAGLAAPIDALLAGIEWDAHLNGTDVMWHAPPGEREGRPWGDGALAIRGWNEALAVFVLGAGAESHPLPPACYHRGWAAGTAFRNGETRDGIALPLGPPGGGPMFLSHYSFLGIDPRGLADAHADYWRQVTAHAAINRAHCLADPHGHGYGPACWGLTASDTPGGYAAHAPDNDLGVISPTAAVASLPYAPAAAMAALRHFVEDRGEALWGPFGLVDAFCPATGWVAEATLAIDQGPIVVMIENHRSGLLWRLCMAAPEVRRGLARLGFTSPHLV